jgi:ribosomal-protein-alanine N-acetyltransferase
VNVIETERLTLRWMTVEDADVILELLNDPDWLRYIGDRGVRTRADAEAYILTGMIANYERCGYGFYMVERKPDGAPMGMCGLVKRDFLADVDLGFAFLPAFRIQGYAYESAAAVMDYARDTLELRRLVAITSLDNERSGRLLEKLGFRQKGIIQVPPANRDARLFEIDLSKETTS